MALIGNDNLAYYIRIVADLVRTGQVGNTRLRYSVAARITV